MDRELLKPRTADLVPGVFILTAFLVLVAIATGRIERNPLAPERAELLSAKMVEVRSELASIKRAARTADESKALKALAHLRSHPELQIPKAESYTGLLSPEYKKELVAHPKGRDYKLLISVPVRVLLSDRSIYIEQATQMTAQCEEHFERLIEEGSPMASYLLEPESARLQYARSLSLAVNHALLDSARREIAAERPPESDIAVLLDRQLGWDGNLLRVPPIDVARTVQESGQKIGHSIVWAVPLFTVESAENYLGALARWDCHVWEHWSVLRDRHGSPVPAGEGIAYSPGSSAALVSHIWASYVFPDGHLEQRALHTVNTNPMAHLASYLAYTWELGLRPEDPRVTERLPPSYVQMVSEGSPIYDVPPALHWGVNFAIDGWVGDLNLAGERLKLLEAPGTDLLCILPDR